MIIEGISISYVSCYGARCLVEVLYWIKFVLSRLPGLPSCFTYACARWMESNPHVELDVSLINLFFVRRRTVRHCAALRCGFALVDLCNMYIYTW